MALAATPPPTDQQRPSLTVLRGRKPDRRTEIDDLRMEITAAGQEMCAMSERITNALAAGDWTSAMHFANRLGSLGCLYANPDPEEAA